jgi:hypothetical protein
LLELYVLTPRKDWDDS